MEETKCPKCQEIMTDGKCLFCGNELEKQVENKPARDEQGRLLPGNTANPNGRPKGKTLKEWVRDKLKEMTEEERKDFLKDVPKDIQWRMAEGNPHQGIGQATELDKLSINIISYDGKNNNNTPQLPAESIPTATPDQLCQIQDSCVAQTERQKQDSLKPADNQDAVK